ncbi:hypothetical protein PENSUB_8032 [Penicillium subrubescens]|uniref:Uncharacterized protein n=1 Tax=Penicillium subrubescens TaxID=1316194 RepID=A0A1Q5THW5_9EURO|nr:hypothetical protein PENSUB_8032 [Penicillium subrubescens]
MHYCKDRKMGWGPVRLGNCNTLDKHDPSLLAKIHAELQGYSTTDNNNTWLVTEISRPKAIRPKSVATTRPTKSNEAPINQTQRDPFSPTSPAGQQMKQPQPGGSLQSFTASDLVVQ